MIILHVFFQTERNARRKHKEGLGSPAPHMEFRKDAESGLESFLEGKSRSAGEFKHLREAEVNLPA